MIIKMDLEVKIEDKFGDDIFGSFDLNPGTRNLVEKFAAMLIENQLYEKLTTSEYRAKLVQAVQRAESLEREWRDKVSVVAKENNKLKQELLEIYRDGGKQ